MHVQDRSASIAAAALTTGNVGTHLVNSMRYHDAAGHADWHRSQVAYYGDLTPGVQTSQLGQVTVTMTKNNTIGHNTYKMQAETLNLLAKTGNRLEQSAVTALEKGDTRSLSKFANSTNRDVIAATQKIQFYAEKIENAGRKLEEHGKALNHYQAKSVKLKAWANVHPVVAAVSGASTAIHGTLAVDRFTHGKIGAGIAHSVAAAGNATLSALAIAPKLMRYGNVGAIVAVGGAITAAALDG